MSWIQAILLGIVQGLTEFLPVSSSGHLLLLEKMMRVETTGPQLEILLHLGTLVAVMAVFWRDWLDILKNPFRSRTLGMLIIGTVPAVIAVLLLGDAVDALFSGWFLGISFLLTALLLVSAEWLTERLGKAPIRHMRDGLPQVRERNALIMGLMQAVAILPGLSRSGSTIVGGMVSGLSRKTAAKFSFMMSAIAIAGSFVLELGDLFGSEGVIAALGAWPIFLGVVAAALSGYWAIRWMLALIQRISFKWFALYVAIIGFLVLCDQLFYGVFFDKII